MHITVECGNPACGSSCVAFDAYAQWDEESQDFDLQQAFLDLPATCNECGMTGDVMQIDEGLLSMQKARDKLFGDKRHYYIRHYPKEEA